MSDVDKLVHNDWTWLADYGFPYSEWTIHCEEGRKCRVGMGVSIGGKPRGERITFENHKTFFTVGVGAIKVKVADGQGDCLIKLKQGKHGYFPLYR